MPGIIKYNRTKSCRDINVFQFINCQPGVDFSLAEIVEFAFRPLFLVQICVKKLGIGEWRKWKELSL